MKSSPASGGEKRPSRSVLGVRCSHFKFKQFTFEVYLTEYIASLTKLQHFDTLVQTFAHAALLFSVCTNICAAFDCGKLLVPISIKDIAQKANVSPSTVSRALNDHPRISTETKKLIQELARSMGYVPSQAARNLVTQQSATIGVAVADYLDPFYVSLLASIEDVALANNYDLFVSSLYRERPREKKAV
jgi:transcriptional regulator with XRE-family HTH domain